MVFGAMWMLPHGRLHEFGTVPWFLTGAVMMLVGWFLALRFPPRAVWMFWAVAVVARLVLLFQAPGDDIYRYVWEGRMLLAGWNPYVHAPDAAALEPLRDGLWESVQHKTFTAIYPPLAQWVMALLAAVWAWPMFYKIVFALGDLGVAFLLAQRFGTARALCYAWNPLVIYCFAGGGHYDSLFILAMVLGWLAWEEGRPLRAAGWLGAAVALKWLALPLLAWVVWQLFRKGWRRENWRTVMVAAAAGIAPLVVSYVVLSLWSGEWSLQLLPPRFSQYARSAELIPGIVGWFWEESRYHNHWFLLPLGAGWLWVILRGKDFARSAEWLLFLALVLTPMLHAWYFTWMMPLAVETRNRGALAVTASSFVYFMLYHHFESPGGKWELYAWECALLWIPFVAGFFRSACWPRAEGVVLRS